MIKINPPKFKYQNIWRFLKARRKSVFTTNFVFILVILIISFYEMSVLTQFCYIGILLVSIFLLNAIFFLPRRVRREFETFFIIHENGDITFTWNGLNRNITQQSIIFIKIVESNLQFTIMHKSGALNEFMNIFVNDLTTYDKTLLLINSDIFKKKVK